MAMANTGENGGGKQNASENLACLATSTDNCYRSTHRRAS